MNSGDPVTSFTQLVWSRLLDDRPRYRPYTALMLHSATQRDIFLIVDCLSSRDRFVAKASPNTVLHCTYKATKRGLINYKQVCRTQACLLCLVFRHRPAILRPPTPTSARRRPTPTSRLSDVLLFRLTFLLPASSRDISSSYWCFRLRTAATALTHSSPPACPCIASCACAFFVLFFQSPPKARPSHSPPHGPLLIKQVLPPVSAQL